jgi:lipopolysaccharide/colanic/teichoic acid biosynthesis glycosyltransferase
MSFVGYRPERQYFIDKIMEQNPDYRLLYQSTPGVTSLATIENGYTDTMEKMLRRLDMDLDYLRNRSLWMDAKIIFKTIFNL